MIVEIGSWKGKSTIALARGASTVHGERIYAIDPHKPLLEEGYAEDSQAEFLSNITRAGVAERVVSMIMTSEEAARGWNQPIRLLWIDGDHRYKRVKLDFTFWSPTWSRVASLQCTTRSEKKVRNKYHGKMSFVPTIFKRSPSSTTSRRSER